MRKATHILWDTDDIDDLDESVSQEDILANLPAVMEIPDYIDDEDVPDYMFDETGYCPKEYVLEKDD